MSQTRATSLEEMANAYSRRAREARILQGKPAVISNPAALQLLAELMSVAEAAENPFVA